MTYESNIIDQAGRDQIDIVAAKFHDWRSKKTARAEKVPLELLREAQKLSQHYKATDVRRRLGLTRMQMEKLDELDRNKASAPDKAPDFMQLVPLSQEAHHAEFTIDVCTAQGVKISLSGFATQDPLTMIAKLIGA